MKRSQSSYSLREIYPTLIHNEANTLESDIQKIIDEKMKINRGYIAGLICLVIAGIILIIVLGLSFIGAFIAIFFVCCVIHIIRKVWRYLLSLKTRSREQQYEIRLSSLNLYLKSLKKSSLSLTDFESILEKVFQEFLPAIVLRIHNPKLSKELNELIKYLKSDSVHSSMLNAAMHLELSIIHKRNQVLTAARLRSFFIPIMHLLKQPPGQEGQELEIVRRIADLLSMEQTQVLLLTFKLNHDKFLKTVFPFWMLAEHYQETSHFSRMLFEVDSICNPSRTQFTQKLLMFRRNSFDDKDIKHSRSRNIKKLKTVQRSIVTFTATVKFDDDESILDTSIRSIKKPVTSKIERESIFEEDSEKAILVPKNVPVLFSQDKIVDLEGSESDNENKREITEEEVFEPQNVKIVINDNSSNRQDGDSDSIEIISESAPKPITHRTRAKQ